MKPPVIVQKSLLASASFRVESSWSKVGEESPSDSSLEELLVPLLVTDDPGLRWMFSDVDLPPEILTVPHQGDLSRTKIWSRKVTELFSAQADIWSSRIRASPSLQKNVQFSVFAPPPSWQARDAIFLRSVTVFVHDLSRNAGTASVVFRFPLGIKFLRVQCGELACCP